MSTHYTNRSELLSPFTSYTLSGPPFHPHRPYFVLFLRPELRTIPKTCSNAPVELQYLPKIHPLNFMKRTPTLRLDSPYYGLTTPVALAHNWISLSGPLIRVPGLKSSPLLANFSETGFFPSESILFEIFFSFFMI